jgi:pSer/pThr/pTyr-binding forkhead associated (FHA) protein
VSFVLQRVTGRGLVLNQIGTASLRIGRGTSAELRSENPAVALEHAVIDHDSAGYSVTDKGSITGTYVNGKPVESARLTKGDVIEVGDLRIEVQLADPARPLFLRVQSSTMVAPLIAGEADTDEASVVAAAPAGGALKAPKVDYVSEFRLRRVWLTKASLMALAAIVALTVVSEVVKPENQKYFMPGGVSSAHARARDADRKPIAEQCSTCHAPWRGVTDRQCNECHAKPPHSTLQRADVTCVSCHPEHRGAEQLALTRDTKCVACHSDLAAHVVPGAKISPAVAHIPEFGRKHPEFEIVADRNALRFNHKLHLQAGGIFNSQGRREVLVCTTCHKLVADARGRIDPKPVKFAADCQRCHRLTFDARFPDLEVPHGGDPGLVYGAVVAAHSGQRDLAMKSPDEIRRILTTRSAVRPDESAIVDAEHVIKTKCTLCHDILRNGSRLVVTPPVIPARWIMHVDFAHTSHRALDCEKCHDAARRSSITTEVLIPKQPACFECHGSSAGRAASTCVTCHDYHERSRLATAKASAMVRPRGGAPWALGGEGGMLGPILLSAIVVLLLVVLIPVGIATYQRLKPREDDRPARRTAAPLPPPITAAASVPPIATPPPPEPESPNATQIVNLGEVKQEASSGGSTEMVQWYGMLLCSSGPLEGKHFVIEEKGLYIGRDGALSQIVIADSRVSKRHVRIVPRDGRVHAIDQASTNGTFLAAKPGERITDIELKRGDVLILGDGAASFTYQI